MGKVDDIVKIKREVEQDLLKKSQNITDVSVSNKIKDGKKTDEVVIRVNVKKKRKKEDLPENERIPEKIRGISTDVIEQDRRVITYGQVTYDKTVYTQLVGGANVGPPTEAGTCGAIALDSEGQPVILSCAHVFAAPRVTEWSQGTLIYNPNDNLQHPVASLKNAIATNGMNMDAAIATINDPHGYKCEMADNRMGPITGSMTDAEVHDTMLNKRVKKIGVRTGFTTGVVNSVDARCTVFYDNGTVSNELAEQIEIHSDSGSLFSDQGDSGACIMDDSGKIVGLLIGGDAQGSFATPIERVLKGLDIAICPSI